jgi:hypothetical protein
LTHLAYALDLAILVPSYAIAAVLLWRRAAWGHLLATVLLVAGVGHQLGYMVALVFQTRAQITGATASDPVEPFILALYVVALALLVAAIRKRRDLGLTGIASTRQLEPKSKLAHSRSWPMEPGHAEGSPARSDSESSSRTAT